MKALLLVPLALFVAACTAMDSEALRAKGAQEMQKGYELYEAGNYRAAYAHLLSAYRANVRSGRLLFRLGYCQETVSANRISAKNYYKEALAWCNDHPDEDVDSYMKAYCNYGSLFYAQANRVSGFESKYNMLLSAKKIWDEGLSIHPTNQHILERYPRLEIDLKRISNAMMH